MAEITRIKDYIIVLDDYSVCTDSKKQDRKSLDLTPTEQEVFEILCANAGKKVKIDEFMHYTTDPKPHISNIANKISKITKIDSKRIIKGKDIETGGGFTYYGTAVEEDDSFDLERFDAKYIKKIKNIISNYYWSTYKSINFENNESYDLFEVFQYPKFVGEDLKIGESSRYNIVAPNGFGKSTLIKTLLLSLNNDCVESTCKNKEKQKQVAEKIKGIRKKVGLVPDEDYLGICLDAKKIILDQNQEEITQDNCLNILHALLFKSNEGINLSFQEFKDIVSYYNHKRRLFMMIDGTDELVGDNIFDFVEKLFIEIMDNNHGAANHAKLIMAGRPLHNKNTTSTNVVELSRLGDNVKELQEMAKKYIPSSIGKREDKKAIIDTISNNTFFKEALTSPALLSEAVVLLSVNYVKKYGKNSYFEILHQIFYNALTRYKPEMSRQLEKIDIYERVYEKIAFSVMIEDKTADIQTAINQIIPKDAQTNTDIVERIINNYSLYDKNKDWIAPNFTYPYFVARFLSRKYIKEYNENIAEFINNEKKHKKSFLDHEEQENWCAIKDIRKILNLNSNQKIIIIVFLIIMMCDGRDYIDGSPIDDDQSISFLDTIIEEVLSSDKKLLKPIRKMLKEDEISEKRVNRICEYLKEHIGDHEESIKEFLC